MLLRWRRDHTEYERRRDAMSRCRLMPLRATLCHAPYRHMIAATLISCRCFMIDSVAACRRYFSPLRRHGALPDTLRH